MSRFHITAPAGPCQTFFERDQVGGFEGMMRMVESALDGRFKLTADEPLFLASEDIEQGGRVDDERRARDIQDALSDPETRAILAMRGGAWLTRVLPRIDFDVLRKRDTPVVVMGFSEITSLVNIVAGYPMGIGVYGNSPAFLPYGLRHRARYLQQRARLTDADVRAWAREQLVPEFQSCIRDVVAMIDDPDTSFALDATIVGGEINDVRTGAFVGGNLTVFPALLGRMYRERVLPKGHWIFLEDYNDKVSRLDRLLAHLTLDGAWDDCAGILLGDFHCDLVDQSDAMLHCLRNHLPAGWDKPILRTAQLGHVFPMIPLVLQRDVMLIPGEGNVVSLMWSTRSLRA